MGETLHVSRHIILLHQVIPHGAGLTDVLPNLYQFAHHLRGYTERGGVGFRRVNEKETKKERKERLVSICSDGSDWAK